MLNLVLEALIHFPNSFVINFFNVYQLYSVSKNGQVCIWECDTELEDLKPWQPLVDQKDEDDDDDDDEEEEQDEKERDKKEAGKLRLLFGKSHIRKTLLYSIIVYNLLAVSFMVMKIYVIHVCQVK